MYVTFDNIKKQAKCLLHGNCTWSGQKTGNSSHTGLCSPTSCGKKNSLLCWCARKILTATKTQ